MNTWWLAIDRSCTSYQELKHRKVVAQGWNDLGDLRTLCPIVVDQSNWDMFRNIIETLARKFYGPTSNEVNRSPTVMWNLLKIEAGDVIVGIEGTDVKGFCQIKNNGWDSYKYNDTGVYEYSQTVGFPVDWIDWDANRFGFTPNPPAQSVQGLEGLRKESQKLIDVLISYNLIVL